MRWDSFDHQPKNMQHLWVSSLRASTHMVCHEFRPRAVDSRTYRRSGLISLSDCSNASIPSSLSYEQSSDRVANARPTDRPRVPDDFDFLTPADLKRMRESFSSVRPSRLPSPDPLTFGNLSELGRF